VPLRSLVVGVAVEVGQEVPLGVVEVHLEDQGALDPERPIVFGVLPDEDVEAVLALDRGTSAAISMP
jgi:hypothetical protein